MYSQVMSLMLGFIKKNFNSKMSKKNSAKLISYTVVDFSSEAEMELYLVFFEKNGPHHFEKLSALGCVRWRINRVWNKTGGFSVSLIYEYANDKSFKDCQIEIGKFVKQNESFYKKLNIKRTASRAINILDFQN